MDQTNSGSNLPAEKQAPNAGSNTAEEKLAASSPNVEEEVPISERRQAYGTAKTENLQDSGLWRIILPGFVILCCLAMLAIPLIILIPLLSNSVSNNISLVWLWIVLIVLDVSIAAIAIRGLLKIFMTPAENYSG